MSLRKSALFAAVLAAPIVAGCLSADDTVSSEASLGVPRILPWGLDSCDFVVAFIPVAADRVADRLPEGFRALSPAELGLPPDMRGDATVSVEAFTCPSGVGLNGTVEEMTYGSLFITVEPPEELKEPDTEMYFVKYDVLIPDEDRREALAAAGVPARAGTAAFTQHHALPGGTIFVGSIAFDDTESYGVNGFAPQDAGSFEGFNFVEFTPVPGGFVTWRSAVDITRDQAGTGYVRVAQGTWLADIVGVERAPASFLSLTGSFVDASITLP
ncbi:MAG: hypothetical protein ACT4PT_10475 [Methanobacteriota archaeon]